MYQTNPRMAFTGPVLAVTVNPALDAAIENFRHAMMHDGNGAEAYRRLMNALTERVVAVFALEPLSLAGLAPDGNRLIDVVVDTGTGMSAVLANQLVAGKPNDKLRGLLTHIDEIYAPASDWNGDQPCLCIPVDDAFAARFREVADSRFNPGGADIQGIKDLFERVATDMFHQFFLRQMDIVGTGYVGQKVVTVGVAGVRKACNAVLQRVIVRLGPEEMSSFIAHFGNLLKVR